MDLSEIRDSGARHPWETSRAVAIERVLRAAAIEPSTILDYGCGDGFTGERVRAAFGARQLQCFDIELSDEQCTARSTPATHYGNNWDRISTGPFDLCLLCDVLEHVSDEQALLGSIRARLVSGGHLLVTVPAFQALFTSHDRGLRHFRRYSLAQLEQVLKSAGLKLESSGYLFASLLPARGISKLVESLSPKTEGDFGIGGWNRSPALTAAIESVLNADNRVLLALAGRGIKLPGLSAWALCRNRE